jgi:hypothetical protein
MRSVKGASFMDWSSRLKLRLFLTGVVLFLVSGFYSCQECKYALAGKKAPARITRIKQYEEYGGSSPKQRTAVEFEFTDNRGLTRQGKDTFDDRVDAAEGDSIEVQYRAGADGDSRVAGHANTAAVYLFIACLLAVAALSYPLVREIYTEVYAPKKKRR